MATARKSTLLSCQLPDNQHPTFRQAHHIEKPKRIMIMTKILISRIIFNAFIMYLLGRFHVISVTKSWHIFEPYHLDNIDTIFTLGAIGLIFSSIALIGTFLARKVTWLLGSISVFSGVFGFLIVNWLDYGILSIPLGHPVVLWMIIAGLLIWGANKVFDDAISTPTPVTNQTTTEEKKA